MIRPIVAGLASGLLVAVLVTTGTLEPFELWAYDRLLEMRGPRPPRAPIMLVAIDEVTAWEVNRWPLSRVAHAVVVERVAKGGALAIGLDLLFLDASRHGAWDDAALAPAIAAAGNVVLAVAPRVPARRRTDPRLPLQLPFAGVAAGAISLGVTSLFEDVDGHVRRVPDAATEPPQPSFAAAVLRVAERAGLPTASRVTRQAALINFRGPPRTYPWVSYYQVVRGEVRPERFRGQIVLVGPTSEALHDMYYTPFARGAGMPGVEVQANVLETLIHGDALREAPAGASAIGALVAGLAIGVIAAYRPRALVPVVVVSLLAIVAGAGTAFFALRVWVRTIGLIEAVVLSLIACVLATQMHSWRAWGRR